MKTVLITGANKGIGRALMQKMLQENYFVIAASRNGIIADFEHPNMFPLQLDLSNSESIKKAHEIIFKNFKQLDVLINNAGIGPDLDTDYPDPKTFAMTFEVNVMGTVFFTEPLLDIISENGVLLNISSEMGSIGKCERTDSVAYRMSKTALNMYTKILKNRLKGKINMASVHPGWVKTTLASDNIVNGRISPETAAENIYEMIDYGFENGVYWDTEDGVALEW